MDLEKKSQFNHQSLDKIIKMRTNFAINSIKQAIIRVNVEKFKTYAYDELEIERQQANQVDKYIHIKRVTTELADTACVMKGRFNAAGNLFATVGSSGQGKIWNTQDNSSDRKFCEKISVLITPNKICDVVFHPKAGQIPESAPNLLTGSSNGEIYIWTLVNQLQEQKSIKLKVHKERVNGVAFDLTGNYFFSSSYDKTWAIYDCCRLQQIYTQRGHEKQIHTSCVHPDGSLFLTADLAGQGMLWDLRTGNAVYQFTQTDSILCASFSPNGYQIAVSGRSNLIGIFDIRRKKELKCIPGHVKLVSGLHYSDKGQILASCGHDNLIKIWNGRNYTIINDTLKHTAKLTSIDINTNLIASTTIDHKWTLWKVINESQSN